MTVLYVEDVQRLHRFVTDALDKLGVQYVIAQDVESSLRLIEEEKYRFDFAIVDWGLPNMGEGLGIIKAIRGKIPGTRIVVPTSNPASTILNILIKQNINTEGIIVCGKFDVGNYLPDVIEAVKQDNATKSSPESQ